MNTTEPTIFRGTADHGHIVNDFFEEFGVGRPMSRAHDNPHVSALMKDGRLLGVAYAAAATTVTEALLMNGFGYDSIVTGQRFQALEALVIHPDYRGQGHGRALVDSVAGHAQRDFGAEYLLARVDAADADLQGWYTRAGFYVCKERETLAVSGVPVQAAEGYRDSWRRLTAFVQSHAHPVVGVYS